MLACPLAGGVLIHSSGEGSLVNQYLWWLSDLRLALKITSECLLATIYLSSLISDFQEGRLLPIPHGDFTRR